MEESRKNIQVKNGRTKVGGAMNGNKSILLPIYYWKLIQKKHNELEKILHDVEKTLKELQKREVKPHIRITNLIVKKEELTAQLDDGRELSIPIDWFAKWGIKGVNEKKLKNYEIWEGEEIYFPDLDEVLGIGKFINGFDAPCE